MTTNYERGRAAEYRAMRLLEEQGYVLLTRSASSKGLIDVWAAGPDGVKAIQVKKGKRGIGKKERERLAEAASRVHPACSVEVWWFKSGEGTPTVTVLGSAGVEGSPGRGDHSTS